MSISFFYVNTKYAYLFLDLSVFLYIDISPKDIFSSLFTKVKSRVVSIAALDISPLLNCGPCHTRSLSKDIQTKNNQPFNPLNDRSSLLKEIFISEACIFRKKWINKMPGPLNILCIPAFFVNIINTKDTGQYYKTMLGV